jgi:hypothetical protein
MNKLKYGTCGLKVLAGVKKNCWEFKVCGQERTGRNNSHVKCPVPEMTTSNGINGGKNAGRICWLVSHTMCKGETDTTFEEMIKICGECDFYKLVKEEEGEELVLSLDMLREAYEKNKTEESKSQSRKHR